MSSNINNIKDKGGNKIAVAELDSSGQIVTNLTAGVNCLDAGHLANSDLSVKTKKTSHRNEAGEIAASDYEYEGITSGILMETDKQKLDYLSFGVRNKKHLEYKYLGIKNGSHQEVFKIVEITPQMKISAPGGAKSMPYESTAVFKNTDFVLSQNSISAIEAALSIDIKTAGPVTIPKNSEHVIVESAVS